MKNISLLIASLLFTFLSASGQHTSIKENIADKDYTRMKYASAIQQYEEILQKDSSNTRVKVKLADSYFKTNDTRNAERVYKMAIQAGMADSLVYLRYAEVLSQNGKYTEAKKWFEKLKEIKGKDNVASKYVEGFNKIDKYYADSSNYKIYYLSINTQQADFSPAPYNSGFIFSSARVEGIGMKRVYGRDNTAYLDLYFCDTARMDKRRFSTSLGKDEIDTTRYYSDYITASTLHTDETRETSNDTRTLGYYGFYFKPDAKWGSDSLKSSVSRFHKKINTKYHEGPAAFTKNGDTVYFSRNNYNGLRARKSEEGINKLKIYMSAKKGKGWTKPKPLPFCNNEYSVGHPALSSDGKTMYFTSDMKGSLGSTDIFKSTLVDGKWSEPENLGNGVNSEGEEMFPYVDGKNNIYFASTGKGGLGGLDIFEAKLDKLKEGSKNMGYPVNSKKDDFGFIINNEGTSGFFSSNRKRGGPDDDIYGFTRINYSPVQLKVKVLSALDSLPIQEASISLRQLTDNIMKADTLTSPEGYFGYLFKDKKDITSDYSIPVTKKGYLPGFVSVSKETLAQSQGKTVELTVYLQKIIEIDLCGTVFTKKDKKAVPGALVFVYNSTTHKLDSVLADAKGNFCRRIERKCDYIVKAVKENHFPDCYRISVPDLREKVTIRTDIPLSMIKIGLNTTFEVKDLFYDYNKSNIRPDAALVLDNLVEILTEYPAIKVELGSHTDARGKDDYNQRLSQRRADSAVAYVIRHGIDKERITAKGYGESKLINRCKNGVTCSDEEHQKNRRTEVRVTGFLKHVEESVKNNKALRFDVNSAHDECKLVPYKIYREGEAPKLQP